MSKKYFIGCLIFILCLLSGGVGYSANKTFTGPGNFSDPSKWDLTTLPIAADNIRIVGTCTLDAGAANLAYGTLNVGFGGVGSLVWPAAGTNTLNVTAVSSSTAGSSINMTNGGTLQIRTSWTTTNQTFTPGTGTIHWNNTAANTTLPSAIAAYYNLIINSTSRSVSLGVNTTINNNLTLTTGILQTNAFLLIGNATGLLSLAAGTTLRLGSTASATNVPFPTNFAVGNISLSATSTVTYQANTATQAILSTISYGNLIVSGGASVISKSPTGTTTTVLGNLSLGTANTTFAVATNTLSVTGRLSGAGGLSFTTGQLNIGNNNTHTGTFTCGTGTVNYNRAGNQTVRGTTYHNLIISNSGTSTIGAATIVNGNLTISGGTLASSTFQITGNATGIMSMAASTALTLGTTASATAVSFPTNFTTANISLSSTSTVTYQANTAAQVISSTPTYGNLTVSGGVTVISKSPSGALTTVTRNLVLGTANTTFAVGTNTLSITGTLSGAGRLSTTTGRINLGGNNTQTGTFTCGTGTFEYTSSGTQTVRGTTYHHLIISNAGTSTIGAATAVNGNLTISGGTLGSSTFQITGNATGIMSMAASTILTLGTTASATAVSFPTNFTTANISLNATSTVTYQSNTASQSISSTPNYGNLTVSGGTSTVTKAPTGTLTSVLGNLVLGATNTTFGITTNTLSVTGTLSGAGRLSTSTGRINLGGNNTQTGTFTCGTGTFDYNGSGAQIVRNTSYNDLIFSNAGTKTIAAGTTNIASTFTVTGTAAANATANSTSIVYNGSGAQSIAQISYHNLSVSNAGVKTLLTGTTNIAGNFSVAGSATIDATTNSSTLNFNGSVAQAISGTQTDFYNITVANGASVSLSSAQRLVNELTLSGTGLFTTNNFLTLLSSASRTAGIAALGTPANFSGDITMQRYVSGAQGYRYVSAPISNATLAGLTPEIRMDGFPGATAPGWWCNVYTYNEAASGSFSNGWTIPSDISDAMIPGKGYAIYFYSTNIPVTLDLTGTPNKGPISLPVTYNSTPHADDGWNLVSNPYPSAIDWDAGSGWTRTNIQGNTIYYWNDAAQNYATYPLGGPGINGGSNVIPSGQGFMVKASAASPVLDMTESVKTNTNPSTQFWKQNMNQPFAIQLKLTNNQNNYFDETLIRFKQGATDNNDSLFDALKIASGNPSTPYLSTETDDSVQVCINTYSDSLQYFSIPIYVKAGVNGTYTLRKTLMNLPDNKNCVVLEDLILGSKINLNNDSVYMFSLNTSVSAVKRFMLHIIPPPVTYATIAPLCFGQSNGAIVVSSSQQGIWNTTLRDSTNAIVYQNNSISQPLDTIKNLSSGSYYISSVNSNSVCGASIDTVLLVDALPLEVSETLTKASCTEIANGAVSITVGGGTIPYSYVWSNQETTSTISYLSAGNYSVIVFDSNMCRDTFNYYINADTTLTLANFSLLQDTLVLVNGQANLQLTNNSANASNYMWDFGDGFQSTDSIPLHIYNQQGNYVIRLVAYDNSGCPDTLEKIITILNQQILQTDAAHTLDELRISATNSSIVLFDVSNLFANGGTFKLTNLLGQKVIEKEFAKETSGEYMYNIPRVPTGFYMVVIETPNRIFTKKTYIE
ncbi:MAG: PKD domain-containing protein [Bacteroidetes bacterium]|nr:PKD domain-containing protein [Bacteroidota bacterium]